MEYNERKCYVVGIPEYWQTLMPPLQHTLSGFGVMVNQFEPLVRRGRHGVIEPMAAKSWELSQDKRIVHFKIDTSRRFSDGSFLSAVDFKRSWEYGLQMRAKSSNSSLSDALSDLKGFSQLGSPSGISGLRVLGSDVLELEFGKPMRSILEHLSGVRYSVYKLVGGVPIGTGPYVISEAEKELVLIPNPYYVGKAPGLRNVRLIVSPAKTALTDLQSGKIDALLFADFGKAISYSEPVKYAFGQEGRHNTVILNGMPGRFFANPHHRLAFQSLLLEIFDLPQEEWPQVFRTEGFVRDAQSFLPFQAGRLPDSEVHDLIAEGKKFIPQMLADAKHHPLRISYKLEWLVSYLQKQGITLDSRAKNTLSESEWTAMIYKTFEPDIMPISSSVYDGDPDCLYHMLGRHGAIFSPMMAREGIMEGLENGRKLLALEQLPRYYQGVARKIFEEVPYVHLGFYYRSLAYNSKILRINDTFIGRNNQSLTVFDPN